MAWMGYALNTIADLSGMVIVYNYGRLQQIPLNVAGGKRKRKLSRVLLGAEAVTVLYSAFFSWRQLRIVLPVTEPTAWPWVALISAGFVPLLLATIGYTQALLAGRFEEERKESLAETAVETVELEMKTTARDALSIVSDETQDTAAFVRDVPEAEPVSERGNGREPRTCGWCGRIFATQNALNAHARWCKERVKET